jgi:hypothetical protein
MLDDVDNEEIKGIEKVAAPESYYSRMLPRGYLSVSQVTQYLKCGEAYRRRYVLEQPIPPTSFTAQGRSVHKAAEVLHNSIIASDPLSLEEMEQVFSDTHDTEMSNVEIMEDGLTPGKIKDAGMSLTRLYHQTAFGNTVDAVTNKLVPAIEPIAAERVVKVDLTFPEGDPIPFLGVIDLEEAHTVSDLKTKRKAVSQLETDSALQLSLYAHITGKPHVRLDQLIKPTKTLPARFIRTESVRTRQETLHALDVVADVAVDIAAGRFRRTAPENWWCTEKWCPYWGDCRGRKR